MVGTKTSKDKNKKIQRILRSVLPFLVAAGFVKKSRQHLEVQKITAVLGHKTVTLPNKKITSTRYLRRGQRYVLLNAGKPIATVDLASTKKGKQMRYHVTYGPTIAALYKTLQWLTSEYHVPELNITAIKAIHLGKNFLYDERMKNRMFFEVTDNAQPAHVTIKELLKLNNEMIGFLEKEHKKFKKALRIKLREASVVIGKSQIVANS